MTPKQRKAERDLRRRCRGLLDDLDALRITFADLRAALLVEPGVRLLATKTRRQRGRQERLDLISYRRPGGPRRRSYLILRWGSGWEDVAQLYTLAEARIWFDNWSAFPKWYRAPVLLDVAERMGTG